MLLIKYTFLKQVIKNDYNSDLTVRSQYKFD